MSADHTGIRFHGESSDYRNARQTLLEAERSLRREVEKVAALRRALPDGHQLTTDYVFDEMDPATAQVKTTHLSELFRLPDKSLIIYNFMYSSAPCPMCTAFLDSLNGVAKHAQAEVNIAVVAKAPINQLKDWAEQRDWSDLRMLSSASNSFNLDYLAETESGDQLPQLNVFRYTNGVLKHFYTTEMFFSATEPDQHPRHLDMVFPLWNLFDLTAEGRPASPFPRLSY